MNVPEEYKRRLADMGGRLPNGTPKMRIVDAREIRRPHGKLEGTPKYIDPETGKPMEFLVLETWIPPILLGSRDTWNYDFMGVWPGDCDKECCDRGYWGLKSPLTVSGEFIPLTEALMLSIERKHFMDVQFSMLSEKERLESLDANLASREQKEAEDGYAEYNRILDDYLQRKEELDNADNRIYVGHGKSTLPDMKGGKLPIGKPR